MRRKGCGIARTLNQASGAAIIRFGPGPDHEDRGPTRWVLSRRRLVKGPTSGCPIVSPGLCMNGQILVGRPASLLSDVVLGTAAAAFEHAKIQEAYAAVANGPFS